MDEPPDSLATDALDLDAARKATWRWVGGMVGFFVFAAVIGGALFTVPYVALMPGSARDTESLIAVDGIELYPSDGELLLTTVQIRQRPNLWEYLWLQTDGDVELVPEEVVLGDRTADENRDFNLQLMDNSKAIAVAVALRELGYESIRGSVVVVEVVEGSAADGHLELGDTVSAVDGAPVASTSELIEILEAQEPSDEIVLSVEAFDPPSSGDGPVEDVTVELGARPDDPDSAFLGVALSDQAEPVDDLGFTVDIDSGSVGGPSAGLAFTLAILDALTAGELTGGATVAVTGTIDVAGRVGAVGGVVQKAAAVRDMGADLFIVPAGLPEGELAEVMDRAGDDLKVVPVDDLEQALAALAQVGGEVAAVEEFAASNLSQQSS
jgi:PDZ domain-containing protein